MLALIGVVAIIIFLTLVFSYLWVALIASTGNLDTICVGLFFLSAALVGVAAGTLIFIGRTLHALSILT